MHYGLHFCNIDLHVHTPASECFIEPDVSPQMIVDQAINVGLKAIAITDHNSARWVDKVNQAAQGTGLSVFPGVEITVQPGVHVLAIFPEDRTEEHVNDLLRDLGFGKDDRGKNTSLVTKYGVQEVVSIIRKNHGALPVLAHIDGEKGAWTILRNHGQTLLQLWQAAEFAAIEIIDNELPSEIGQSPYDFKPAYYWASDNPHPEVPSKHSHRGIGNRYSRFKLSEPVTWEGLRLCFQDPAMRIRPPIEEPITHPIIQEINIEGGFLDGFNLYPNPNLNCIIGGRGTGKSCLLELVRYTFDADPKTDANRSQAESILRHTFPAGSRFTIKFNLGDGSLYHLERVAGQSPKIYRTGSEDPLPVSPVDLMQVQVYGQKEVYEISRDPSFQLRLLDNYLAEDLQPLKREEEGLIRELRDNASQITRLRGDIDKMQEEVDRLGAIEEELRRMEQQNFVSRLLIKSQFDQEKRILAKAQDQVGRLTTDVDTFLSTHRLTTVIIAENETTGLPNGDLLLAERELLADIDLLLTNCLEDLKRQISTRWSSNNSRRQEWADAYDEQETHYQTLLREFQNEDSTLKPERYVKLKREQKDLQEKTEQVLLKQREVNRHQEERTRLLLNLRQVRRAQYEIRRGKASGLTQALGNVVRITIWPEGHREPYQKQLDELFKGLRVYKDAIEKLATVKASEPERPAQRPTPMNGEIHYLIPEIPRFLDPIDLANAIREEMMTIDRENHGPLTDIFGITSEQMRRNISSLSEEKLFELEILTIPDLPVIELHVGRGELGYKPLESLSVGQKCTAILSLVLLESQAPLLIDQPEDDLDNHFIFDQIVTTLRNAKEKRQFIIATHNANIPVSGDAELIVVLNADERKGWIVEDGIGSIDSLPIKHSVERILEGGETAFKIRKEKYGI